MPIAFGVTAVLAKMAAVAVTPRFVNALRANPTEPPPATLKTPDPKTGLPPNSTAPDGNWPTDDILFSFPTNRCPEFFPWSYLEEAKAAAATVTVEVRPGSLHCW
jgi:hypothetical protein